MDFPTTKESIARMASSRASVFESLRGCGFSSLLADNENLRLKLVIPKYLRCAILDSIKFKDVSLVTDRYHDSSEDVEVPECPMVVFINSKSGGRHGHELRERLQQLISDEQVFDLSDVKPWEFIEFGLGCLEKMALRGDSFAEETRNSMRIMVAGGDGTVGWVLGSLYELHIKGRNPVPPIAIIPLGTGNDLARTFGWGGSFPYAWKLAVKRSLGHAINGRICHLDSWHITLSMFQGDIMDPPHTLKATSRNSFDQDFKLEEELSEKMKCYQGVFYNYFSIGMDAQVAYSFHRLRNEKPYLAQGPISNKLIYSSFGCTQGWFVAPCLGDPDLRGLTNVLRMHVKRVNSLDWEEIPIPKSVRAIVALNLHNYGSGRNPWGSPSLEYLEKRGFVEAHADDGLLEIFGLKQGWHATLVMIELISAKHIAQAAAIRFELHGGKWDDAYMQMDGEPWKQPINRNCSSFIEIERLPFHSLVISGE